MAELLGVAASIAGLATAAAAICKVLAPYAAAARDTPQVALQVRAEIEEASISLASLQGLASNLAALPTQRTFLIQVDHLVAILTNGVLVFSDLETCVGDLPSPYLFTTPPLRRRLQWTKKESDLKPILARLQGFKASVSMILGILQSDSLMRAEQWQAELSSNIADLMRKNRDMSRRLMSLEAAFDDSQSCITIGPYSGRIPDTGSMAPSVMSADEIRDDESKLEDTDTSPSSWTPSFEFEEDLNMSLPYRRAKRDIIDPSPRNSVTCSNACWSMISGISLGKISTLAVVCLPVYADEISNSQHYRFTGLVLETGTQQEVDWIRYHFQSGASTTVWICLQHQDGPGSLLYYDAAILFTPHPPHWQPHTSYLHDRLYIFSNNIVVVRDRSDAEGDFSVGWVPFNHLVSITPRLRVPVKANEPSFPWSSPQLGPPVDLVAKVDSIAKLNSGCRISLRSARCPTPANNDGTVDRSMRRPNNIMTQIEFASELRRRKAVEVIERRYKEMGNIAPGV